MYGLGYLEKLDYSKLPNVEKNLIPALRHPESDPQREFTVPWQAGMTGLIVRKDLAPDVNSICDLFDPKYKGKVDDADRNARHRADDPQVHGDRPRTGDRRAVARRRRKDQGAPPNRGRSGASPATTTTRT